MYFQKRDTGYQTRLRRSKSQYLLKPAELIF